MAEEKMKGWFGALTFGDTLQAFIMVGSVTAVIVSSRANIEHEGEMRRALETRTIELIGGIRTAQIENTGRWQAQFDDNVKRDREAITEIKAGMQRLAEKIDQVQVTQYQQLQQIGQQLRANERQVR